MKIDKNIKYYDIKEDIKNKTYDTWLIMTIGGNSRGKTYSTLKYCLENKIKFVFIKRTNDDVKLLSEKQKQVDFDLNPFKAINRDLKSNIHAKLLDKGIGCFYDADNGDKMIGYIFSLNAISSVKGFDLSDVDIYIFDEFIPMRGQVVSRSEGINALVLYQVINRDREIKGKSPLLMIALANSTMLSNPFMQEIETIDIVADMKANKKSIYNKNGIYIHLLDDNEEFTKKQSESAILKSLKNTNFGKMSLNNEFSFDSFDKIKKQSIKGYKCIIGFIYRNKKYYIYKKANNYYVNNSKNKCDMFDLSSEAEQHAFYYKYIIDLRIATINNKCFYETYNAYDIIFNYKKNFKIF